ncbi:TPA: hypothetical protein MHK19_09325 [Klebsiella pneumoniae]|nr:hypothetical protein [Klebsiella pneumoniae]
MAFNNHFAHYSLFSYSKSQGNSFSHTCCLYCPAYLTAVAFSDRTRHGIFPLATKVICDSYHAWSSISPRHVSLIPKTLPRPDGRDFTTRWLVTTSQQRAKDTPLHPARSPECRHYDTPEHHQADDPPPPCQFDLRR